MKQILVVCTGNICRSPMGEIVLRDRLAAASLNDAVTVASAGVSDEEHGHGLDRRAAKVLKEAHYEVPQNHFAHRATREELLGSDLILAMTVGHARALASQMEAVGDDLAKLHLWREFDGTLPVAPEGVFGPGGVLYDGSDGDDGNPEPAGGGQEGSARAFRDPARQRQQSNWSNFYTSDGAFDVPDPWYGTLDDFYETLAVVEAGADGIVAFLNAEKREV